MKVYSIDRCEEYSKQNQQQQSFLMILMMESWSIIIQNILGLLSTDHTQPPTGAKAEPRLNFFLQFIEQTDFSTQTSSMGPSLQQLCTPLYQPANNSHVKQQLQHVYSQ